MKSIFKKLWKHLGINDNEYKELGVKLSNDENEILNNADIIVQLGLLSEDKNLFIKRKSNIIGVLNPYKNKDILDKLVKKKVNPFSLELLPRITEHNQWIFYHPKQICRL